MEMKRLQQQELKYQRRSTLNPVSVSVCSASQPPSTPLVCSATAGNSLPFELPDVNISDLLSLTVQSPKNIRSSLVDNRRTPSTSWSVSSATSAPLPASSRQCSRTGRSKKQKDADKKKKVDENCRQNNVRSADISCTADSNRLSVAATVMSSDSRKRPAIGQCTSAQDSDDEFEDLHCSNIAKKRAEERQYVDCTANERSVAAEEIINKSGVESSSKQEKSTVMANVTNHPSSRACSAVSNSPAVDSGSARQKVAERLSKFAFNDNYVRQRQESSTAGIKSQDLHSTQHNMGNCYIVELFAQLCMCIHTLEFYWWF